MRVGAHADVGIGTSTIRDHETFVYGDRRFEPLWFRWDGKPLMLATPNSVPPELADQFTWRTPIAPYDQPQHEVHDWAWLSVFPQTVYRDANGRAEEMAVGVAQNYVPAEGRTSPMNWPGAMGRNFHAGKNDERAGAVNEGLNFQEQWDRALKVDPRFIFVTGWNEWLARRMDEWSGFKAPPVLFIDLFNEEFSRDIEPMRGGHGDNYYYQLAANIRRYEGVRPIPTVVSKSVVLDERFDDWKDVAP